MEIILCVYCGDFSEPSPRHKNQTACKKIKCLRTKKAAWQRHKMKTDPDYQFNQKLSQKNIVDLRDRFFPVSTVAPFYPFNPDCIKLLMKLR
jgi:hypothetical protein